MIIPCFRCGKRIDTPDVSNADYVIVSDMVVKEPREVLIALKHNQQTLEKLAAGLPIADDEYEAVEIPNIEAAIALGEDLVKVVVEVKEENIQKTGIICPDCYKDGDFVIWGVHKK